LAESLKVEKGSDVILPCSLWTKEDLRATQFIWQKISQTTQRVFLYDNGDLYSDERPGQSEQFKGRVSHFKDELEQGNASITIRNTRRADSGVYRCIIQSIQKTQIFHIKLDVVGEYFDVTVKDVFLYDKGERPDQSEQFKGRVSHFPDKLKQGNASITIKIQRGLTVENTDVLFH
uniref:Ig-like domain-containing protein n=1 Tax=Sander lucioperca TaxID=283035 RepID=A0A8D0AGD1_SANLU